MPETAFVSGQCPVRISPLCLYRPIWLVLSYRPWDKISQGRLSVCRTTYCQKMLPLTITKPEAQPQ